MPEGDNLFGGIPFGADHPYDSGEATDVLKAALDALENMPSLQSLGLEQARNRRRGRIPDDRGSVWDVIALRFGFAPDASFSRVPHLTLGIHPDGTEVVLTLPNDMVAALRNRLIGIGSSGFMERVRRLVVSLGPDNHSEPWTCKPTVYVRHRHYPNRNAAPISDGYMRFDMRVVDGADCGTKAVPAWVDYAYTLYLEADANVQLQLGAWFPHADGLLRTKKAANRIAAVWIACGPVIDTFRDRSSMT